MRNGMKVFWGTTALVAVTAAVSLAPLGAAADSTCKTGKETDGCVLKVGAFVKKGDQNAPSVSVTKSKFKGKTYRITIQVPGHAVCGGAKGDFVNILVQSTKTPIVGETVKVKGSYLSPASGGNASTPTKLNVKVEFKNANRAVLNGTTEIDFADGTKCKKTFSKYKLSRVLGG